VIGGTFITEKNLLAGCSTWELSSKAQHIASGSSFTEARQYSLTLKSLFMWSHIVDHCMPSHDDYFHSMSLGNVDVEMAAVVLCKMKLILGAYCVGVG